MKSCIWCKNDESQVTFNKDAHIVPQSLGGKSICPSVCDKCNHYFGSPTKNKPAIELVFKETFNITRARLLIGENEIGKNKALAHFKSVYFNIDFPKGKLDIKPTFKLRNGFQSMLCRQFKRGLYKVFLEETERINNTGLDKIFDFIREFARYDIGDYPVLYYPRSMPMILLKENAAKNPHFGLDKIFKYMIQDYSFFEIEFLGHLFAFPTAIDYEILVEKYLAESIREKGKFHKLPISLNYLTDIDLTLSIMNV
jgi:hypothetical protein